MPTKSRIAFEENAGDVKRLLEIHTSLGGTGVGRRTRLEVLNKSAVVLITAIWEAYCEDLAAEALDHIVDHVSDANGLPIELRRRIAKEVKEDKNEVAVWKLADNGWKGTVRARLESLHEERNRRLNTPKSVNIDDLFMNAIGLERVSDRWHWHKITTDRARKKLDDYVELRGSIAHRGKAAVRCRKAQVDDYFDHVKRLVARTGGRVNAFVKTTTKSGLW